MLKKDLEFKVEKGSLSRRYVLNRAGVEERTGSLVLGSLLMFLCPAYILAEAIAKTRRKKYSPMNEWINTLNMCYEIVVHGKSPQKNNSAYSQKINYQS